MINWDQAINNGTFATAALIFAVGFSLWASAKERESRRKSKPTKASKRK